MSTVNLKKGSNYHIKKQGEVIEVSFTDGGTLYKQTVTGDSASEKSVIGYLEEKILLSDGKTLQRVRDVLTIVD